MQNFPQIASTVQRNCDISDARHAGDYGLCIFLLKMREFYRWENELPFARKLSKEQLGEWLAAREQLWDGIESDEFLPLPLANREIDPFDVDTANRALLPHGYVYSAGLGRFGKPVFFLGELQRVETRSGCTVLVSSCEHARELAAPPAMLQGRTIFLRQESLRRYLWEKIEDWQWHRRDNATGRAMARYGFVADPEAALRRMAEDAAEAMILHEVGEAMAGALIGDEWHDRVLAGTNPQVESLARSVRDLLADCLSTLPALIRNPDAKVLHLYFATLDAPRRQMFPEVLDAYEHFVLSGARDRLSRLASEGAEHWLSVARGLVALDPPALEATLKALVRG